jgi:competence ComEA-like helix-hairpin-helix protein
MKKRLLFLIVIFLFETCIANCSENQIDINSASLKKLDELKGIGPVKAQAIIDTRPFDSIDKLIDVHGIGEITLNKIKTQGLACVEEEKVENKTENNVEEIKEVEEILEKTNFSNNEPKNKIKEEIIPIELNAQTIKSNNSKKVLDKNKYSLYGFIGFCFLLVILFIIKARRDKDEFRD